MSCIINQIVLFLSEAMASLSEEVLLVVKRVRQRKQDGTLYLMAERIAWGPEGKDRFTVSHLYADIRCEFQISASTASFGFGWFRDYKCVTFDVLK